ncbi:PR-1 [Pyrrhoderma noxium]|uniref:PR-1 n=1 Tax=Pyrrhoderma noxium TaxID=2282107 RepID=A0A286UNI3_9AGAM|nr:PR-1 [Pyrrhoderma noxium]
MSILGVLAVSVIAAPQARDSASGEASSALSSQPPSSSDASQGGVSTEPSSTISTEVSSQLSSLTSFSDASQGGFSTSPSSVFSTEVPPLTATSEASQDSTSDSQSSDISSETPSQSLPLTSLSSSDISQGGIPTPPPPSVSTDDSSIVPSQGEESTALSSSVPTDVTSQSIPLTSSAGGPFSTPAMIKKRATSPADIKAYLDSHNSVRAKHGAKPLTWSDNLASVAQNWANRCVFKHSGSKYGENLAAGSGDFSIPAAIKLWADEASSYDPKHPQYSHFTQVVWKSTKQVGCARATCNNLFQGWGPAQFYVCNYDPAGNVIGQFGDNVQP